MTDIEIHTNGNVVAEAEIAVAAAVQRLRDRVVELEGKLAHQARWRGRLVDRLHEEANDRSYCSDFDDIMAELGLPRRKFDYDVSVEVTFSFTMSANAETPGDASDTVENDEEGLRGRVRDAVAYGHGFEVRVTEVEVA